MLVWINVSFSFSHTPFNSLMPVLVFSLDYLYLYVNVKSGAGIKFFVG